MKKIFSFFAAMMLMVRLGKCYHDLLQNESILVDC